MNFELKMLLNTGTMLSFSLIPFAAHAIGVSNWAELKAAKGEADIAFTGDILATGETYPMPIYFNLATEQTIDGNNHSFSEDSTPSGYYSLSINNTGNFNLKNFGKSSTGSASDNTFSYKDLSGNTIYTKIEKSVSSFSGYFLTINKPIVVNVENNVFANNGKESNARLIYVDSSSAGTLNITNNIFYNNTMASVGPVVYGNKHNLNIENSVFYGNKVVQSNLQGGAVRSSGKLTVNNSYFVNNSAIVNTSGKGGAIYFEKRSGSSIENSKFEGNTAGEEGGAVYMYYNANADYIKNSQFIGNKSLSTSTYGGGGGLALGGGYLRTIDNVLFDSNSSANKGGGLYVEELSSTPSTPKVILVKDTTFKNNDAKLGGGMYFSADYGNNAKFSARLVDPEFTSNTATKGGALYVENGDVAIISENKDVIFSGNTATDTSVNNAGDDIYFRTKSYASSLFLNAAEGKKIVFNGSIATAQTKTNVPVIDINKSGITYSTYDGNTKTVVEAGTLGEVQFNKQVGDEDNISDINLYTGTLTIGNNTKLYANLTDKSGTVNISNQSVTAKTASFESDSTLALTVNNASDHGLLTADTITVAEGATLKATLAQGVVKQGETITVQLLKATNTDFNNFTDSFDNNMYSFEKADKNGLYKISQTSSAEDIVTEDGGQPWVAEAAGKYVDEGGFKAGTVPADIANALASLAQNDADALIAEIKALAPTETAFVQDQAVNDVNRLFKTVDDYLRGNRGLFGFSSGDENSDVSIWANPYIGTSKLDRRGKIDGMSTDSHGIIAGIEKNVNPTLKFGVGIQYDETDIDMNKRDIDSTSTVGFVYGEYKPSRWFVNTTVSYGVTDYDEDKYALNTVYKANYNVRIASATAVTGYQFKYFTPEIGIRYYDIKREGYVDGAMQSVRKVNTDILRAFSGIRFTKDFYIFSPNIYFGMTYDIRSAKPNTVVNLANDTSYTVVGKRLSRIGYELDVGVNTNITDDLSVGIDYMGTYREKYQEHTGMLKLKYDF